MSGLDRNELDAFLVQAGLSGARDHALACLLALNGLRVSEAIGTDVDDLGLERGHHTVRSVAAATAWWVIYSVVLAVVIGVGGFWTSKIGPNRTNPKAAVA